MGFGSMSFNGKHEGSKRRHKKKNLKGKAVGIIPIKKSTLIVPVAE
jgi:hypothetical protein